MQSLNAMAKTIHADNQHWWQNPATGERLNRNKGEMLMLMVSEISECMEGERRGLMDDHLPHRRMAEVELADAMIRIFDFAGGFGLDLERQMDTIRVLKPAVNKAEALLSIAHEFTAAGLDAADGLDHWVVWRLGRAIMRIEQYAEAHGYDLGGAIIEKHDYNGRRADHKRAARLAAGGKKW